MLTGCGAKSDKTDKSAVRDVFAMDTYMNIRAYGENAETAVLDAENEIHRIEKMLSVTDVSSDISAVNSSHGKPVEIHGETAEIISYANEISEKTDGALDITVYPVLREWGFTTGEYKVPDDETLSALLEKTGFENIITDGNTVTIPDEFMIDLGALAKGYTSDRIMDIFSENSVANGIVSLGGNVQMKGTKPDGSLFRVGVANPFSPDSTMCILEITEKAVITSGNYERFFEDESGQKYWHIIDTADGYPADNGLVSVTVIGESGLMCDALSTALFVCGEKRAEEYWRRYGKFDMILVTDDKRMIVTDGIADCFENKSDMSAGVIHR